MKKSRKIKSKNVINISNNQIIINSETDVYGAQLEFKEGVDISNRYNKLNIQSGTNGKIVIIFDQTMTIPLNEKVLFEYTSRGKFRARLSKYILSDKHAQKIPNVIIIK